MLATRQLQLYTIAMWHGYNLAQGNHSDFNILNWNTNCENLVSVPKSGHMWIRSYVAEYS